MSGPKASVSRWATPAVGSSRQRNRASRASSPASSTMRRVPVDRSRDVVVGVAAEPEEVDELVGLGPAGPLPLDRRRQEAGRSRGGRCGPRASRATSTVSRTVSSGNSVAAWKLRPRPSRARAAGRLRRDRRRRAARPSRTTGRSRRWRSSAWTCRRRWCRSGRRSRPRRTSIDTSSTARMPPKRTTTSLVAERGHPGRRAARAPSARRAGTACRCFGGAGPSRRSAQSRTASRARSRSARGRRGSRAAGRAGRCSR